MKRRYYVYIMASRSRFIYAGMTNDLKRRVYEHKQKRKPGFTRRYNVTRLVYYEEYDRPRDAIYREKEIKGWLRQKKEKLIEAMNPSWDDLSADWFGE